MKKLMFVSLLAALAASSAFAVSVGDWYTYDFENSRYGTFIQPSYYENYGDAGISIDIDETTEYNPVCELEFISNYASDWIYNPNDTIALTFTGFDVIGNASTNGWNGFTVYVNMGDEGVFLEYYEIFWTGPGTYILNEYTPEIHNTVATLEDLAGLPVTRFGVMMYSDTDPWRGVPGTKGTMTISVGNPDEKTEVPEPASAAYALIGLAPVFGLKRRIKK